MNRREALERTAWIMGGLVSAPAISSLLHGCTVSPKLDWKPVFLTEEQAAVVSRVVDIIIPATDTPGAVNVGVPAFIDVVLKDVYSAEDQQWFIDGLNDFDEKANNEFSTSFIFLQPDQQAALVKRVHDEAINAEQTLEPKPKRPFMLMTKELSLLGFFTSEVGAKQVLQYNPVPGSYHGCVPLEDAGNGRTWAT